MTAPEPATAEELQQEIEQTRERLGQTVEELAAKADVKGQARAKATEVKARVQGRATETKARAAQMSGRMRQSQALRRFWPLGVTAAGSVMIAAALVWRWRTA